MGTPHLFVVFLVLSLASTLAADSPQHNKESHGHGHPAVADADEHSACTAPSNGAGAHDGAILCENECGREATVFCNTCNTALCSECNEAVHSINALKKHPRVPIDQRPLLCEIHKEPMTLYCEQDHQLVCSKCLQTGAKHHKHAVKHVDLIRSEQGEALSKSTAQLREELQRIVAGKLAAEEQLKAIAMQAQAARSSVGEAMQAAHAAMALVKQKLLQDVAAEEARKTALIASKIRELQDLVAEATQSLEMVQRAQQGSKAALVHSDGAAERLDGVASRARSVDVGLSAEALFVLDLVAVEKQVEQHVESWGALCAQPSVVLSAAALLASNAFAPLQFDAVRRNARLVFGPDALTVTAGREGGYQMAVGSKGMEISEGSSLAFFQVRVVRTSIDFAIVGLVSGEVEVGDNKYPGSSAHSFGWASDGNVYWTLPGPKPQSPGSFVAGDNVTVVLDSSAGPLLRLVVNGQQRLVHPLQPQAAKLYPAVALWGDASVTQAQQPCVQAEAAPTLPALHPVAPSPGSSLSPHPAPAPIMSPPSNAAIVIVLIAGAHFASCSNGPFHVVGNKIYDETGAWVVFRGIGISCTEYMQRPYFPYAASEPSWPGKFAWENCVVGRPGPNQTFSLNNESAFILNYLLPDHRGGKYVTQPIVNKVPVVRVPVVAGSWMYDLEDNEVGAAGYRAMIDLVVQYFTSHGVAVIIDQHESCVDGGKIANCSWGGGAMASRYLGNYSGAGAFWDMVAHTYASNPLVLYELYNEPHVWYQAFYGGDTHFIGMAEMLDIVRNHTATGLVLIGGREQYAMDAAGSIAFVQQYMREHQGAAPSNVIYNLHPYVGAFSGLEHALRSAMRLTLALQQIGPVFLSEFGQFCCNQGPATTCSSKTLCDWPLQGSWFVNNIVNMAVQYDVSWTGFAWRGPNAPSGNCSAGWTQCDYPDMRGAGPGGVGLLTNGSLGGANWSDVWSALVSPASQTIAVQDALPNIHLPASALEPRGYLPRPCMTPDTNMGAFCGWPLGTAVARMGWVALWNQTVFQAVLPGLPPSLAYGQQHGLAGPALCTLQACPGYTCSTTSPIIPSPDPCQAPVG